MNCPEVMELMQRHLDEDLDQKEETELAAHLQGCLDCRLMLERLQELSDELAQLPKVMPPFSLVDSILPQLDAIDRQAAGQPEPFAAAAGGAGRVDSGDVTVLPFDKPGRERRTGSPISWKVAGGVVAAGLIIGLFAFNVNQPSTQNADMAPELARSQAKMADQRSAAAATEQQEGQSYGYTSQDQSGIHEKQDVNGNASASAGGGSAEGSGTISSTEAPQLVEPQAVKPEASLHFSADAPASEPSPPGTAPSGKAGAASKQPSASAGAGASGADASGGESGTAGALAAPAPDSGGGAAATDGGTMGASPAADESRRATLGASGDSAAGDAPQTKAGKMMLGTAAIPTTLASPSGIYVAALEDRRVVIRQADSQEIVFASERVWSDSDTVSLLAWSQDDRLTYSVESGQVTQVFTMDVKAHTESQANK
ncbi:zf-HC2 domain-containing protein [Paenibacillus athensensis]|uniref:Anti-sigma-W factor RsiW n=1 Tax=Paenibacillus athensensis TaxID=1967502 RepID=A0A4Y8Q409_9BACL|nr:zf-HC2 domain-containing protein [Paenibacillus athensensis]MCD1258478.1 zf-HC2 domain-containing protein [Paenibacillus athensensis]